MRSTKLILETGKKLHSYVPLYLGRKTPMVAVRQDQNENLVFLRVSLNILQKCSGCIISDGNAASFQTKFREFKCIDDLDFLDVKAIQGVKYASDLELKRRKQAEILIPNFLKFSEVIGIVVFSDDAKNRINFILSQTGTDFSGNVYVGKNSWYFVNEEE